MKECVEDSGCITCIRKLALHSPVPIINSYCGMQKELEDFLKDLNIDGNAPTSTPIYNEGSLAAEIVLNVNGASTLEEVDAALSIFSLGDQYKKRIRSYLVASAVVPRPEMLEMEYSFPLSNSEDESSSCIGSVSSLESEYNDSSSEDDI